MLEANTKNIIKGVLKIDIDEIYEKGVILFNTNVEEVIDALINNEKINIIKDREKRKVDYKFKKNGNYTFEIIFNNKITDLANLFESCQQIISLDFSDFDTSEITNMKAMFFKCTKLEEIKGLNKFITNKVNNMSSMFAYCEELEYLDLSNFDFSNVTSVQSIFNRCYKLKEIKGINKLVTNKVNDIDSMFQLCKELEFLDLSDFDTSSVTTMAGIFNECYQLKEIKGINKFITDKVENMYAMFQACTNLEYLDLSNFNTSNVRDFSWMFNQCNKLKYLNLLNFTLINCKTKNMFVFNQKKHCKLITSNKQILDLYNSS